jgi:hypothetical protein
MNVMNYRTETDTDRTAEAGWKVRPLHVTIFVAPPSEGDDLGLREYYSDEASVFRLERTSDRINDNLFDRLTEESVQEHGDIWRKLASL